MREGLDEEGDDQQTELWVEKFKPRCYTDLLSDNGTNRTLLMWLKLWDKLVFGKERKVKKAPTEEEVEAARWKAGAALTDGLHRATYRSSMGAPETAARGTRRDGPASVQKVTRHC